MAASYGSIATNTATSGDLTITKPSSLAAGDMMIACIETEDTNSATTKTNWTELQFQTTGGVNARNLTILAKVADASDAAASDFTFTNNGGNETAGALIRVTGSFTDGIGNFVVSADVSTQDTTTPSFAGITTRIDNDLLVIVAVTTTAVETSSTYAVANSNPTWTERADFSLDDVEDISMAIATATYATAGATGNFSWTASGTNSKVGYIFSISETANSTQTPDPVVVASAVQAPSVAADANVSAGSVQDIASSVIDPAVSLADPTWSDVSKSSSTWSNTSKS